MTAKGSFYSGLHEHYQPLVVHLKDKPYTMASDLGQHCNRLLWHYILLFVMALCAYYEILVIRLND